MLPPGSGAEGRRRARVGALVTPLSYNSLWPLIGNAG